MTELASRSSRARSIVAAGLGLAALAGCGGDRAEPVARLTAEPARLTLPYGSYAELELGWRLAAELEQDARPRVFLHLLDADGELARTFDHDLPGPWRSGQEWRYRARIYQSLLAPPLPPGAYTLTVGLYGDERRRWPLEVEGERIGPDEYRLAAVEVPSRGLELPAVGFSPTWSPTLAGGDRQVVAFRWLSGDGAIQLRELSGPGTLWLGLRVPGAEEGELRRRLLEPAAEGDGGPRVRVAADCGGFAAELSGDGHHDLKVPLAPGDGACEVTLTPNYVLDSPGDAGRSVLLEVLAWRPN
jgi:hypothetical protein